MKPGRPAPPPEQPAPNKSKKSALKSMVGGQRAMDALIAAATKAIGGDKEAMDDFVLAAPTSILDQYKDVMMAAQAVSKEK